ncbi:phosphotransferase, partial [bacterium]|nr:phosphotransferase [bacterium]
MLFNETVIKNKQKHLDAILKNESVLRKLLNCFSEGQEYEYSLVKRPWDPGGGSTLFSLQVGRQRYFLKVKRCKVFVESKLEAEESFTDIPSLRNEYHFFQRVKDISANTPKFFKYVEEDGFSFLFIEHLLPLKDVVGNFNAKELLEVYEQIKSTVRHLYENSIVHTDIHENNIMFRGNIPVLIDFEEARVLLQEVPFEESLDVAGENAWGNIGRMPEGHGFIDGYTCLNRLKKEFEKLILSKLDDLIKKCNFDSSCPFLNALDHGKDERIYQSINLPGYSIEGQRPLFDDRIDFILRTTDTLFQEAFTHLDIGSNLGRFNIEISKSNKVKKS